MDKHWFMFIMVLLYLRIKTLQGSCSRFHQHSYMYPNRHGETIGFLIEHLQSLYSFSYFYQYRDAFLCVEAIR